MDPAKLKVVELRAELSKRGLDTKGNKAALVERLQQALKAEQASGKAPPAEPTGKSEKGSESEEESPEPAKLPPRTPSRSSRHTSREPTTPVRTPTRSSSRSSLSRQSPAKTILAESNEATSTLEPIVEEDKVSPKKEIPAASPKGETLQIPVKKDAGPAPASSPSPKKDTTSAAAPISSPQKELTSPKPDAPVCQLTPKKEEPSAQKTKDSPSPLKKENVIQNESPKKDEQLEIVKEAEKHVVEKSQEITRVPAEDFCQKPDKANAQSPVKATSQSPVKAASQSPVKAASQSPVKASSQSPVKAASQSPAKTTVQSPEKPVAQSPNKTIQQSPAKATTESPNKSISKSPLKPTLENQLVQSSTEPVHQSPVKQTSPQKADQKSTDEESPKKKLKSDEAMETEKSDNKSEVEEKSESMDVDQDNDDKTTSDTDEQDDKDDKSSDRKRKRTPSPIPEDAPRAPPIARPENEPKYDEEAVLLSWYDSDLHLVINTINFVSASPMQGPGFNYMWAGTRISYGFNKGKVFYEVRIDNEFDNIAAQAAIGATNISGALPVDEEKIPSTLRVGWSVIGTPLQLGEDKLSFGYEGTGKKSSNKVFEDYGKKFAKNDIVGCYADFESDSDNVILSYTVNSEDQGPAFTVKKEELEGKALFPHLLSKNCTFTVNLGQEEPWSKEVLPGFEVVGKVDLSDRIAGPRRPEKREDCEVILLCGLPFSGKTAWASKHVAENPDKLYSVLGTHNLIEKMTVDGLPFKDKFKGRWENVVEKCTRALTKLLESAPSRRRNFILDQSANVYGSTQRRKMRNFYGFHRKAIVLIPSDEQFKERIAKRKEESAECEEIRESSILEFKANLTAPTVGESFEEVVWAELDEEEGKKLIENYNKEGKTAGYGQSQQQQPSKRTRFDNGQKDRNNRDNRDNRRPGGYHDRRTGGGGSWQSGGGGGGWRDNRMRGQMRHGGNPYYGSQGNRRGRGGDRRQDDRRQGNDRNRSRQGWSSGGYQQGSGSWSQGGWHGQGQSQGSWSNQGSWSQPQQGWGSQGSWKNYGQTQGYSQAQTGQSYGNGSSWGGGSWGGGGSGSQYYNQYWTGQQQQQQTAASQSSGGQAQQSSGGQAASKK